MNPLLVEPTIERRNDDLYIWMLVVDPCDTLGRPDDGD